MFHEDRFKTFDLWSFCIYLLTDTDYYLQFFFGSLKCEKNIIFVSRGEVSFDRVSVGCFAGDLSGIAAGGAGAITDCLTIGGEIGDVLVVAST